MAVLTIIYSISQVAVYPVRIIVLILKPFKEMPGYYLKLDHDLLRFTSLMSIVIDGQFLTKILFKM